MKEKLRKAHVTDCVNVTNIKHKPLLFTATIVTTHVSHVILNQ